jgi:AcrR family transcriptional regulator
MMYVDNVNREKDTNMLEDTRAKILRVTRTLIDTEGLEAVTLRAVGAEGGLSRGAAYRHFANKDELLATIALEDFELLRQRLMPLQSQERDPAKLLMTIMEQFYEFGIANKVHYQLMFGVVWEPETYPVLHERGKIFFEQIRQITENLLLVNGHAHHDSTNRTAMLFAFMHGLVQLHLAGHTEKVKGLDDAQRLMQDFLRLLSAP